MMMTRWTVFHDLGKAWEGVHEHQRVRVAYSGEGCKQNARRGGGLTDCDSELGKCHALRLPRCERPCQREWILSAENRVVVFVRAADWS